MKRKGILGLGLTIAIMLVSAVSAYAQEARVLLDGEFLGVSGVIVDDRTLLPVRALTEAVGGDVDWNDEIRQVTLTHGTTTMLLTIDSYTAYIDGSAVVLDVPAQIIDGSTFLPLRFISESLGLAVSRGYDTAILRSPNSSRHSYN